MNEHRTASFVAKAGWVVVLVMEVAVFAGHSPKVQGALALVVTVAIALVASAICAPDVGKKKP